MKAIATLALISVACASEDNELFKFNNTKVANQTHTDHIRHHPIHHNGAHNVTVKPKPLRPIRPIFFNRTQTAQANNRTRHFELPIHKPIRTLDDEELFLNDEIAENELTAKGPTKWINRNKEWLAPVGGKILDKIFSALDDDELFLEVGDNELMSKKMKQFLIANPQFMPPVAGQNPEQANPEQAVPAAVPQKKKGGPGKWIGRNKEWIAPIGEKVLDKILSKLDDDELFLGEVADNELNKGIGKWADRNKEWIAPVAGKVLDKILSKLDDDEFFLGEVADNELMSKKMKQFLIANPQFMPPVAGTKPQQAAPAPVADPNAEQAAPTEQAAPAFVPKKKKGGPGKWIGRNKEWIAPIGGKILDKVLSALDDDELFLNDEIAENELSSQGPGKWINRNKEWIAPVAGKILDKVLSKLDAEDFAEDELHFLGVVGKETGKFFKKNGKTIASVGMKVLPALLLDEEENELFNLGGLIKDGLNIYGDVKNKDFGGLVNHGIQTVKDIKKHDDDELFNVKHKSFLGPL